MVRWWIERATGGVGGGNQSKDYYNYNHYLLTKQLVAGSLRLDLAFLFRRAID